MFELLIFEGVLKWVKQIEVVRQNILILFDKVWKWIFLAIVKLVY